MNKDFMSQNIIYKISDISSFTSKEKIPYTWSWTEEIQSGRILHAMMQLKICALFAYYLSILFSGRFSKAIKWDDQTVG